jgi:hypothetical protein
MFADFIGQGYPLVFNQVDATDCRKRIALSILNKQASIMPSRFKTGKL